MAYKHFIHPMCVIRQSLHLYLCDFKEKRWCLGVRLVKWVCPNSLCQLLISQALFFMYFQGVLRVRKRVTLSVITVSAIFGVCWITGLLIYILSYYDIYMFGSASYAISDTMFMFNSAINPFVYSLLNERFKRKLQAMFCYKCALRVQPSSHLTAWNTAGACLD